MNKALIAVATSRRKSVFALARIAAYIRTDWAIVPEKAQIAPQKWTELPR